MLQPIIADQIPAVVRLMNQAYRATGNIKSWNTEAGILEGDRTSEDSIRTEIEAQPNGAMLVWQRENQLLGCVWVEPKEHATWYLGSLAVDPNQQKEGLGRTLLQAAEDYISARGGTRIEMTVLNVREALLAWYARRGYTPTGEIKPFPYGDRRFGTPLRDDLAFLVLAKQLS